MKNKEIFLISLLLCIFGEAQAQIIFPFNGIRKIILFADTLKANCDTDSHIAMLKRSIEKKDTAKLDLIYYNLAICYAAKQQADSALYFLRECSKQSSNFSTLILTDTDFDFLHDNPSWNNIENIIDSVYLSQYPLITHKQLAVELYHIYLNDQHARGLGIKKPVKREDVDKEMENLKRVEEIIQEYGWPTFTMVGKMSAEAAFLVVQHSSFEIQRKYAMLLMEAAKKMKQARNLWLC